MKLIRQKQSNERIQESKEIIEKEKRRIKTEKKKLKKEKLKKTKIGKFIYKFFGPSEGAKEVITLKEQIFSMIYFEIIGAILCLLILFALCGGRNYIKLYMDLEKLINVYDVIQTNYYGKVDKEELIDSAISAMMSSVGDDYTIYTDNNQANDFLEDLEGSYEGIGCTVTTTLNGDIIVASIFEDSPAEKAGLKVDDIILKIDGKDFGEKNSDDMAKYIKQSKNSKITLLIKRKDTEKELIIKREKVEVPSVTSKIIENNNKKIGYIDISIFSGVTYKQFKEQLEKLEKNGIEGLVLDVRNDTGGYLTTVTEITNLFLKKGQIIYQLEDGEKQQKIKDTTKENRKYPIAVLINGASASASEILAAAIKESYGGIVIGKNSYGKGTVQKTEILSDGSMIKYTTQKWLTPKGNWINEIGVEPDIEAEYGTKGNTDNQLDVAIAELIKKLS